ncbi:hypothetical protein [Mesorhizobium sp. M0488]|uniref:hypothetical protein n=1 Tax=unclassified Mesorhizobium TaxID=325217 RepID=UPI003339EBCF
MAAFEHDKLPEKRASIIQQMTFPKSFATEPKKIPNELLGRFWHSAQVHSRESDNTPNVGKPWLGDPKIGSTLYAVRRRCLSTPESINSKAKLHWLSFSFEKLKGTR